MQHGERVCWTCRRSLLSYVSGTRTEPGLGLTLLVVALDTNDTSATDLVALLALGFALAMVTIDTWHWWRVTLGTSDICLADGLIEARHFGWLSIWRDTNLIEARNLVADLVEARNLLASRTLLCSRARHLFRRNGLFRRGTNLIMARTWRIVNWCGSRTYRGTELVAARTYCGAAFYLCVLGTWHLAHDT